MSPEEKAKINHNIAKLTELDNLIPVEGFTTIMSDSLDRPIIVNLKNYLTPLQLEQIQLTIKSQLRNRVRQLKESLK